MSKAKSKPGPKSAKAKTAASRVAPPPTSSAKKKKQSTVNGASDHEEGGSHLASSFLEDVGPDEEEAFSSVGPYQCEICQAWLPDGYSQIYRSYMFGPPRLLDYGSATLRCKI